MYSTKDGGSNWELVSENLFIDPLFKTNIVRLNFLDTLNAVMLLNNQYFFNSEDGGKTWEIDLDFQKLNLYHTNDFVTFTYDNEDYIVAVGNNEGLARSIRNKNKLSINDLLPITYHRDLLFPNPASDYLNIRNFKEISTNIEIFSTLGNKLLETVPAEKIFIGDLPSGSYIIKINGKIEKFIKI